MLTDDSIKYIISSWSWTFSKRLEISSTVSRWMD